jgi:hypothetical protein
MDKAMIVERPHLGLGACFITRTDIGPFVQLPVDADDWHGWPNGPLYVATSWIKDAAATLGMMSEADADMLGEQLSDALEDRREALKRVAELEEAVEAMRRIGFKESAPVVADSGLAAVKRLPKGAK